MTGEDQVVGFISENGDFSSVQDDIQSIIDVFEGASENNQASESENGTPVSYVNQWRIHTETNVTANVELFFNDGSLPGDEFICQLFHVMSRMNNVNIHVLLLCMDAGGR